MDCARNIITANFSGGGTSATTAPLWQWDYGQVLCITGIDLPAAFEVHFSTNRTGGVSTVAVGADGQVTIPNDLLTIGKNLNAWIYLSDAQGEGETEYSITIPVKPRPMPETYDAEVSGEFDDVVRQVSEYAQTAQTAADNAGASATAAAASASEAAASASAAESAKTAAQTAQDKAEDAQAAAETAAQVATEKAQQTAQDAAQTALDAGRAESAARSAEAAQTGAESAKTDVETAAQGAAASASTATEKANLAGQAASAAAQSATAAAGSATTAQNAAQTATTKAGEASASATAAAASETAAQTAQTAAEAAKDTAAVNATTATTKAAEAAQSASNAAASKTAAEAAATRAETAAASLTVDSALSDTSTNPVQNKVVTAEFTQVKSALTTGLSGERTLYFTKLDDGVWVPGRIVGSTGEISTSLNVNIYRRDYFDVTYHKITSPIACLSAFLYSPLGEYIGAWKQTTHSVVKATSGFSVVDSLDFDEIRRYYPDCMILVQSKSETIGDDTSYANQNFTVEYQKTVTIKKIQEGIYETVPLNIADWFPAVISPTAGTTSWSATEITTLDYIPDAWSKIKTYEKSFRIAAYDSTGAYQGWFNYKLGLTKTTSGNYLYDFDIDFLRALYPGYKFKITIYSALTSGAYADISALGTITINRAAMYASIENEICYKVPTRFTREALYTESRAESGNNCSVQGLCTDGTYLYVAALAVNGVDLEGSVTLLRKIDLQGNLIASGEVNVGHANDLAYDPNNNIILAVGSMGNDSMTMHKIDPDTLAVVGTFSFATLFALVESRYGITGTGVHCLAYYAPENVFVLSIDTRHYIIVDATFTNVLKVFSVPYIGTSLGQFLYIPNDDMLFRAYAVNNGKADPVEVYDWHGNKILGFSYPIGHRSAYSELEGICIIDGVWYSSWNINENAIRIAKGVPVGWKKVPAAKCLKGFNYNF